MARTIGLLRRVAAVLGLWMLVLAQPAAAQQASFVINLRNTDIQAFAEQVSDITDRTLIVDPTVRGQVTVISTEPLDPDGVWELFQSVLRVYGYAALPAGGAWRIVPQAAVNQGARLDGRGATASQDFVTRLVRLRSLPAEEAVRVLRPLVASFGYLDALKRPNGIVVTDTVENAQRIADLAAKLDQPGAETAIVTLRNASARDVGQIIQQVLGDELKAGGLGQIGIDERSNALLLRGDPFLVGEIRELARTMDTPGGTEPATRVFRLRHADAESVTSVLRGLLGGGPPVSNPVATSLARRSSSSERRYARPPAAFSPGQAPRGQAPGILPQAAPALQGIAPQAVAAAAAAPLAGGDGMDIAIQPATELNAIVVRGSPAALAEVDALVRELDIRRPQVMIEAAIVEISGDIAEQLGVQFGIGDAAPQDRFAVTSFSLTGPSLRSILSILGVPAALGVADAGLSVGGGIGDQFGVLIQALARSSRANLLSTPSITTLDNQPAEIVVGQNVPFLTGTFTPSGSSDDLFSTIEREDVGITLRVVPRVHEGDVIRLEVRQEASSLVNANVVGAVDLITNRRAIETTVLADNGGTIVLGGLITDDRQSIDSKVPVLGDLPVIGKLFGAEQQSRRKQTLFVFLRPSILRDRADVTGAAQVKFDRLRKVQQEPLNTGSLLFQGPVLTLPLEIEGLY